LEREIALLAESSDHGERVNTNHGFWLGAVINVKRDGGGEARVRNVRTWVDADG
jgi:hypothetical protein